MSLPTTNQTRTVTELTTLESSRILEPIALCRAAYTPGHELAPQGRRRESDLSSTDAASSQSLLPDVAQAIASAPSRTMERGVKIHILNRSRPGAGTMSENTKIRRKAQCNIDAGARVK